MKNENIDMNKHNKLEFPKKLLEALMITQFCISGMSTGVPVHILFKEIKDIELKDNRIIITYDVSKAGKVR